MSSSAASTTRSMSSWRSANRRRVNQGVSTPRRRPWSGWSVMPSPPIRSAGARSWRPMMSRTSLAYDAESASTARAASYPVTSQTRVPKQAREAHHLAPFARRRQPGDRVDPVALERETDARGHPTHVRHPPRGRQRELESGAAHREPTTTDAMGPVNPDAAPSVHQVLTPVQPGGVPETRTGQDVRHGLRSRPRRYDDTTGMELPAHRPQRAAAAGALAGAVAELRHRPARGDPARDPASGLRPRRDPLRPRQQLRPAVRPRGGELRALPRRRLRALPRRAGHLHQGRLRHVARALRPGRRLAEVRARLARPVAGADGARLRRHLLQPPLRPGDAGRGDDDGARHGGAVRARRCTPASRRTPPRRPTRPPRSPASSARRC